MEMVSECLLGNFTTGLTTTELINVQSIIPSPEVAGAPLDLQDRPVKRQAKQ